MDKADRIYVPPPRRLGLDPLPRAGWQIISAILFAATLLTGLIFWRMA